MIAYICDRCGKVIQGKPRAILIQEKDKENSYIVVNEGEDLFKKDYCEACTNEIIDFMANNKAKVVLEEQKPAPITKKLTKEAILDAWEKGKTNKQIAMEHNMSPAAVSYHIKMHGLAKKPKEKPAIDKGKIKALTKAGWSIKNIAGDMKVEESEIKEALKR